MKDYHFRFRDVGSSSVIHVHCFIDSRFRVFEWITEEYPESLFELLSLSVDSVDSDMLAWLPDGCVSCLTYKTDE